jgi:hypothetical protein
MAIKIGEHDLGLIVVQLEFKVAILERAFDFIVAENKISFPEAAAQKVKQEALDIMNKKYPNLDLKMHEQK